MTSAVSTQLQLYPAMCIVSNNVVTEIVAVGAGSNYYGLTFKTLSHNTERTLTSMAVLLVILYLYICSKHCPHNNYSI